MKINAVLGDITKFDGDAIVNAANERMLGGGGVDGAIHRAAGPRLLSECEKVLEVRPGVRCPTGEARITPGGNLKAKWVIHTVGPVYRDGQHREPEKLASCYRNSLQLAADNSIKSIAFPSISTGVYGYPVEEAAAIAVREVRNFLSEHPDMSVTFVCFNGPRDKVDVKAVYDKLIGAVPGADVKQEATVSAEPSAKSAAEEDTKRAKNAYQSAIGSLGSSKRWGENHGPTVTVRAFAPVAERLRKLVPEKDRARFVTDALEAKLNDLEGTGIMDARTMIDIGEVLAVVGIAEEHCRGVDMIAIGSRGSVKFAMEAAFSHGEIRAEHGLLWSIQIQHFLDDLTHRHGCFPVPGEVIKFAPQGEVWRKVCAKGKDDPTFYRCCSVLRPSATFRWVDMNGMPADEPEWFREARALFVKDVIDGEPVAKDNPVGASVRANMDVGEVLLISCEEIGRNLRDAVFHVCSCGGSFKVKFDHAAFNVIGQDVVLRSPALDILAFKWFMKEPDDLKPCAEIKVPSISKGLAWLRDNYAFGLGDGQELRALVGGDHAVPWVDANGQAIAEPDWARTLETFRLLYGYCNWSKSYAYGKEEGSFGYDEFSLTKLVMDAYARKLPKSLISGEEVDGSPDYKVIRAAAKSINRHIDKGDNTPNPAKMKAFFEEFGCPWIESFGSDYLEALRKSVAEIHRSKENGYRWSVSVPHKYSPVSYPGTGVISEPQ